MPVREWISPTSKHIKTQDLLKGRVVDQENLAKACQVYMVLDVSHVTIYIHITTGSHTTHDYVSCMLYFVCEAHKLKEVKEEEHDYTNTGKSTSKSTERPTKTTSESTKRPPGRPRKYPVTCSDNLRPSNSCKENSGNLIRSYICTIGINIHISHGSL